MRKAPPGAKEPPITSDERLLLDVIDALRGADNLRDRLAGALQSGAPAVADLAYAVKVRVKEDYKVIEKIQERRAGNDDREPKPTYGVGDVTDLVGLRIITLYRLDVLDVIEALLITIDRDRSSSAPFVAGSISEVIIYSTNPTGDVQRLPGRVKELFESYGLGAVTKIEEKPSNYSSIHLLVRGRGKYRDGYRELPVEIQVRTALEDVWGQIEHSLRYKRKRLVNTDSSSPESTRVETTLRHLGALKTMIDGIAQYGDQIKLQIDELEPELRSTATKVAEEVNARLGALRDLPDEVKSKIAAAVAMARPALSGKSQSTEVRIRILRTALSELDLLVDVWDSVPGLKARTRKETRYIVTMQRALMHFQLGNLLPGASGSLQQAAELYKEMEREFPARLVVAYRLALTFDALGARTEAIAKLRDVVNRLSSKGEPTPKDHWIRAAAPRNLGVMLWEEAKSTPDTGDEGTDSRTRSLELLREAYEFTRVAHDVDVKHDPQGEEGASERIKAANNLLYYLLEYLEDGGEPCEGMDRKQVETFLEEIGGAAPSTLKSLATADTVRRAHAHLGNKELELEAAWAVVRLGSKSPSPRPAIVREALRAAERSLSLASPVRVARDEEPET